MLGKSPISIFEVPKTNLILCEIEGFGWYLGSSQQISSEVLPFITIYQWYIMKNSTHTNRVSINANIKSSSIIIIPLLA